MLLLLLACADDGAIVLAPVDDVFDAMADTVVPEEGKGESGEFTSVERAPSAGSGMGTTEDTEDAESGSEVSTGACSEFDAPAVVGTLPGELDEVSGLAASRRQPGVLWAIEDHGNASVLYALDIDGSVLARFDVDAPNVDWEDLALAPCGDADCLWIADVGDNDYERSGSALYVVEEPMVESEGVLSPEVVPVRYADGPHNVEALAVSDSGVPTLFSKRDDGRSEILQERDGEWVETASLSVAGRGDDGADSQVTAADLWPGDRTLIVRTYERAWRYDLGEEGLSGLATAVAVELESRDQSQVEAVAWDPSIRGWWQTSEGVRSDLVWMGCAD